MVNFGIEIDGALETVIDYFYPEKLIGREVKGLINYL